MKANEVLENAVFIAACRKLRVSGNTRTTSIRICAAETMAALDLEVSKSNVERIIKLIRSTRDETTAAGCAFGKTYGAVGVLSVSFVPALKDWMDKGKIKLD